MNTVLQSQSSQIEVIHSHFPYCPYIILILYNSVAILLDRGYTFSLGETIGRYASLFSVAILLDRGYTFSLKESFSDAFQLCEKSQSSQIEVIHSHEGKGGKPASPAPVAILLDRGYTFSLEKEELKKALKTYNQSQSSQIEVIHSHKNTNKKVNSKDLFVAILLDRGYTFS